MLRYGNNRDTQRAIMGMHYLEQTLIGASSECEDALEAFVNAFGSADEMNAAYKYIVENLFREVGSESILVLRQIIKIAS